MEHSAEFLRCIRELDVASARSLAKHVFPHHDQPMTDEEVLTTLHVARSTMGKTISANLVQFSKDWLKERDRRKIISAVGISVGFHGMKDPVKISRALEVRHAMSESVIGSVKDGLDLDKDAEEISRRMELARDRI